MNGYLYQPVHEPPLRALMRLGMSMRVDSALVAEMPGTGELRIRQPRHAATDRPPFGARLRARNVLRRHFSQLFWVNLAEWPHTCTVELPGTGGLAQVHASWRVHDPAQVVRRLLADPTPDVEQSIRKRVAQCDDPSTASAEVAARELREALSAPCPLPDIGVTCRVGHVHPYGVDGESAELAERGLQHWDPSKDRQFTFYQEVVREGPLALLSLWLMHEPGNVQQILGWLQKHPEQLASRRTETSAPPDPKGQLDTELADLFSGLEEVDRYRVRMAAAHALTRSNVPGAEALLERIRAIDGPTAGATNAAAHSDNAQPDTAWGDRHVGNAHSHISVDAPDEQA